MPTLKNFYRSPFSKWPPEYRTNSTLSDFNAISFHKIQHCSISKVAFNLFFKPVVSGRFGRLHNRWIIIISCYYYYYYYVTPNAVGWRIAILRFFFTIITIILIIILPHIFVHSISRRCLDQTLWNLVGISYAMWSCADKGWFFQNGCRCHGNDQNAKKLKNTKMIIAGYSPNRNRWNLIATTSTSSWMK